MGEKKENLRVGITAKHQTGEAKFFARILQEHKMYAREVRAQAIQIMELEAIIADLVSQLEE